MLQSFLYNHTKQYWTWTFHENAQEHKKRGTSFGKSTLTSTEHFKTIWHHSIYVQQEKEEIVKNTGYEYLDTVHIRIETVYIEISIYIFPIILLISSLERHNLIYNLGTTFKSTACKSPWVWWEKSWGNVFSSDKSLRVLKMWWASEESHPNFKYWGQCKYYAIQSLLCE